MFLVIIDAPICTLFRQIYTNTTQAQVPFWTGLLIEPDEITWEYITHAGTYTCMLKQQQCKKTVSVCTYSQWLLEFHLIEVAMYALRFPPLIFMCASFWRCVYGTAILNVVVLLHAIEWLKRNHTKQKDYFTGCQTCDKPSNMDLAGVQSPQMAWESENLPDR